MMNLSHESGLPAVSLEAGRVVQKVGSARWEIRSIDVLELVQDLMRRLDDVFASQENIIHDSPIVRIVRVPATGDADTRLLLRKMNYGKRSARIRDIFRAAGSIRAFHNALAMERALVPTPRVLAAGVSRKWGVPQAGYLLVEEIQSAKTLAFHAQQAGEVPRAALQRIGEAIARMHEKGFFHGDLTINNVLLDTDLMPWFIDLERAGQSVGSVGWRQSVEDFHRLARHVWKFKAGARRSSLRVLMYYCSARGWSGRERKFVESVFRRLESKIALDREAYAEAGTEQDGIS